MQSGCSQPADQQRWEISSEGWIGRDSNSDVVLAADGVSRRHARVQLKSGQFYLHDNSANGTFVNNLTREIGKGQIVSLNAGDVIQIDEFKLDVSIDARSDDVGPNNSNEETAAPEAELEHSAHRILIDAGLDPDLVGKKDPAEIERLLGEMLKSVIGGMVAILGARTAIKSEIHVPMTVMSSEKNNPLKTSTDYLEAMEHLFLPSGQHHMDPLEALDEGLHDIRVHEMAMMAGMREVFVNLLIRFDPTALEETFDNDASQVAMLKKLSRNNHWEQYKRFFSELKADNDVAFQELFMNVFAEAYEQQIQRAKEKRGKF